MILTAASAATVRNSALSGALSMTCFASAKIASLLSGACLQIIMSCQGHHTSGKRQICTQKDSKCTNNLESLFEFEFEFEFESSLILSWVGSFLTLGDGCLL